MGFQVAQINVARAKAPVGSPLLAGFVAKLDEVNALADAAPGFVWRLQTEDGNATAIRAFDDDRVIVNMSVWESVDDLGAFVYRSDHVEVMRRRREWFDRLDVFMALWWVPAGHVPSVAEAQERLAHLGVYGSAQFSFTFKQRFASPDSGDGRPLVDSKLGCPA